MKKNILKAVGFVAALVGLCSIPFIINKELDDKLNMEDDKIDDEKW